jgi:hypothetical protein
MYEPHNYLVNSARKTIQHNPTAALFDYSTGSLVLKNPQVIQRPEELPRIGDGAEREFQKELRRDPNIKFTWR